MNYANARGGPRQATAIAVAVLVHLVLLYALITGSALRVVEVVRAPFETRIIAEPKPAASAPEQPRARPQPRPTPAPARPPARAAPPPALVPTVPPPEVSVPADGPTEGAITTPPAPPPAPAAEGEPAGSGQAVDTEGPSASVQLEGCTLPEYPPASIAAEETGTVALSFLVGADGRVLESRVDHSSGHRRLDEAARRALGRCKFRPAIVDGKPRQAWAHINYVWRLE